MILGQKYLLSLFYRYIMLHIVKKKAFINSNPDFLRYHTVWFVKQRIDFLDCLESFSVGGAPSALKIDSIDQVIATSLEKKVSRTR